MSRAVCIGDLKVCPSSNYKIEVAEIILVLIDFVDFDISQQSYDVLSSNKMYPVKILVKEVVLQVLPSMDINNADTNKYDS